MPSLPSTRLALPVHLLAALAGLILFLSPGAPAPRAQTPAGTAFTYQGLLTQNTNPADGLFDFQFSLYNAATGGAQQGATVATAAVTVTKGRFSVDLDFGQNVFAGDEARWLQIAVRPGASSGAYTPLTPRQALRPAPYAITSLSVKAVPWSAITGVPAALRDPVSSATANQAFLHRAGPDAMSGAGTSATLSVTQAGSGRAGTFLSSGNVSIYSATSAHGLFKPQTPGKSASLEQIITFAVPAGVYGEALNGGNGVYGKTSSGNAIYGISQSGNGMAGNSAANGSGGYFNGPTGVSGYGTTGPGGYFKGNGGQALQADGGVTVTTWLNVGSGIRSHSYLFSPAHDAFLALSGESFFAMRATDQRQIDNHGGVYLPSASQNTLSAQLHLPNRSRLDRLFCYFHDVSATGRITVELYKYTFATGMDKLIAIADSRNINGDGSEMAGIGIDNEMVDNEMESLVVRVYGDPKWDGSNMILRGISVWYRLDEAE